MTTTTKEYPLFTKERAANCPTARYVGGASRYLCECPNPCGAALAAMLITRDDYMKGRFTHAQYYGQFVTDHIKSVVSSGIGLKRVAESTDQHFNDIPLGEWDPLSNAVPTAQIALANGTGGVSLSDRVCVLKAAAKQLRREHSKPRDWVITVRYYRGSAPDLHTNIRGTVDGIVDYYMQDGGRVNIGDGPDGKIVNVVGIDFKPA